MRGARRTLDLAAAAGVAVFLFSLLPTGLETPEARLTFLDVGQGDAILVEAPNGAAVLVDGGPPGGVPAPLSEALSAGRAISAAVATHPDLDHVGGLPSVLARRRVGALLASPYRSREGAEIALEAAALGAKVATGTLARGDRLVVDDAAGIFLDVLWPPTGLALAGGNDASLVMLLHAGSSTALLTGDAPKGVERLLVAAGDPIDVDVLKLGHHGSKTATDSAFVASASPTFAVVSAGEGNRYGHPAREVTETLAAARVATLATFGGSLSFSAVSGGGWRLAP